MKKLFSLLLALLPALFAQNQGPENSRKTGIWQSGQTEHEGFPLLLRRQTGIAYDALPPKLIVIRHLLDRTKPNGLPEPDYNETLVDFEGNVIRALEERKAIVVVIETFGHKRAYYAYGPAQVSIAEIREQLTALHPNIRLEWIERMDPAGKFIQEYAQAHF